VRAGKGPSGNGAIRLHTHKGGDCVLATLALTLATAAAVAPAATFLLCLLRSAAVLAPAPRSVFRTANEAHFGRALCRKTKSGPGLIYLVR
jgi:hypothetical protein